MNYNFNIKGVLTRVWVWNDNFHTSVSVRDKKGSYERTIREDEKGRRFFTWNKERVYLDTFVVTPLIELKRKIENHEFVTSDDLVQSIVAEGVENVKFICPLNPYTVVVPEIGFGFCDGSKHKDTLCKIVETRYKVQDNYKVTMVPVEDEAVASRDFYTSDLVSLIESGFIKIVI